MTTFKAYFSDVQVADRILELTGTSAYTRFPDIPGSAFRLHGRSTNIGSFLLGTSSGTLAWEIDAGYDSDWFPLYAQNLNVLFYNNVSGASERMDVWVKN